VHFCRLGRKSLFANKLLALKRELRYALAYYEQHQPDEFAFRVGYAHINRMGATPHRDTAGHDRAGTILASNVTCNGERFAPPK
jgi:hypothetical protein